MPKQTRPSSTRKRPPISLMKRMILDAISKKDVTGKALDRAVRAHLTGTTFSYPQIQDLLRAYRACLHEGAPADSALEKRLRCRTVRTDSGVAPITLLTKPYACPGKCVYCPTEARMPKSYVASEPAAARALTLKFDPYAQVLRRAQALERNGHEAKKIELIVKGGTWSAYPWTYRKWFIKRCFDAANHLGSSCHSSSPSCHSCEGRNPSLPSADSRFHGNDGVGKQRYSTLAASQLANETADYRIIGITIETRPDWINPRELVRLRELGVTRVELGVQALDDKILTYTKRGHLVEDTTRATMLLKACAFKTDYHFLPGQPGSSAKHDVEMFSQMFDDPRFRPDMVKIYPCVVLPSAELAEWHARGEFKPLEGEGLIEALITMKSRVPYYCRLSRVIRDFPSTEISGGNAVTNLRDVIKVRMKQRGLACKCLRCREAGHVEALPVDAKTQLFVEEYENAGGRELFLSVEDDVRTTVLGFLRLRLPDEKFVPEDEKAKKMLKETREAFSELRGCAFVRELHTYGQALAVRGDKEGAVQHKGVGKRLMAEAERLARERGYRAVAVISGVGVKEYYRDLGYKKAGTYMKKRVS